MLGTWEKERAGVSGCLNGAERYEQEATVGPHFQLVQFIIEVLPIFCLTLVMIGGGGLMCPPFFINFFTKKI